MHYFNLFREIVEKFSQFSCLYFLFLFHANPPTPAPSEENASPNKPRTFPRFFHKNLRDMDENNLTILLQQGDRNAYKQLFIKYYSPLCEYASQYISDDDSEELVQELMLFLWETRENLVIETSLKSYLFISTKHRCLNAIRKNQYHERIHNQIYEKIKDQFEDPDYYFVNELTENIQ